VTRNLSKNARKSIVPKAHRKAFLVFTLAFPLLFLLFSELLLRIVDYGPDLALFRTERIAGREYYNMNPMVKARYFSRVQFNPLTSMDYFTVPKPPGTFRIFCLGGSTTAGYPYGYIGSFSTFLKERLFSTFPEKSIEVINLGLTATNSFTVLDFAPEVISAEPDLIIVYDGHNEFYGALGVASHESFGPSRWLGRIYLKLVRFKLFLLLRDGYEGVRKLIAGESDSSSRGTMMERLASGQSIPYRGTLYQTALESYLANVEDLASLCREHGIPLIVSSQVSNLRHQRPLTPGDSESLPSDQRNAVSNLYNSAQASLSNGRADSARVFLEQCISYDSMRADFHYELARSFDMLGQKQKAFREYIHARDYDQLRFRTSSDFNKSLQRRAEAIDILHVDIEKIFCEASPDSIVGSELILEHLHPDARGYFLMAKAYAGMMREHGLIAPRDEWSTKDTIDDGSLWERRSLTMLDERAASRRTEILVSGWPFEKEEKSVPPPDPTDRLGQIVDDMLAGRMAWEQAHVAAAEFHEAKGELLLAEKEYQALIAMIPVNVSPYLRLARLFLKQLKYEPAYHVLSRSVIVEPTTYAFRALGAIAIDSGKPKQAVGFLERAVALSTSQPEKVESSYMLALALGRAGLRDQQVAQLNEVLRIDPAFGPARQLLQRLNTPSK